VHQHLWPEPFLSALSRRREPPRLRGRTLELAVEGAFEVDLAEHDLEARLRLLDRDEIDVALVSLPPTLEIAPHEELREAYHEGILELACASDGRLLPLAAGVCREGLVGASVSPSALVAGSLDPLLGQLEAAGQLLFVHPGVAQPRPSEAPAWWAAVVDYTAQMQAAYAAWLARDAARHPRLPAVFAILAGGAPIQVERLRSRGVDEAALPANAYFDTASYGERALRLCLETVGAERLVFGSDAPVIGPRPTLAAVRGLGDAVAETVLGENVRRLLPG
jgi:predicted TIM-barrel fold metal-dependent hydrolase